MNRWIPRALDALFRRQQPGIDPERNGVPNYAPRREPVPLTPLEPKGLTEDDPFWKTYLEEATEYDKVVIDQWNQDLESLLIFAGLFSGILTAFIIEARKGLQEDLQLDTNVLLARVVDLLSPLDQRANNVPQITAEINQISVWVNAIWFVSLSASLASALGAILAKDWVRQYQYGEYSPSPMVTAQRRQMRFDGLTERHFSTALSIIPVLLHIALMLFFTGLIMFLFVDNIGVAAAVASCFGLILIVYIWITFLPLFASADCLFRTPFSIVLRRLWDKALLPFTQRHHHPPPPSVLSPTLDKRAIRFLFAQATSSRANIVGAAKALHQMNLTEEDIVDIAKDRGHHILAQVVETSLAVDGRTVVLRAGFSSDEMLLVLRALQNLMERPPLGNLGVTWPFQIVTEMLGSAARVMGAEAMVRSGNQSDVMSLRADTVISYAYFSLGRYRFMTRGSTEESRLDPWSEQASLSTPVARLISVATWLESCVGAHKALVQLRVVRALAAIGAVLRPAVVDDDPYVYSTKEKMIDIYSSVLTSLPLPHPSLLYAALLGVGGLTRHEHQEIEFQDAPSRTVILDFISTLLEGSIDGERDLGANYHSTRALLALVRQLHLLDGIHHQGSRLIRAIRAFVDLKSLDYSFQARCTLHQFNLPSPVSDHKVDTLQTDLLKDEDFQETDPEAFGALSFALVLQRPSLTPDQRLKLLQHCISTLESVNLPSIFDIDMIRGLTQLDAQDTNVDTGNMLLAAILAFSERVVVIDKAFEVSSCILTLIHQLVAKLPASGAITFMEARGFNIALAMMNMYFPRTSPPPLVPVLHSVISRIIQGRAQYKWRLWVQLNETALLSEILARENVLAAVKATRYDWINLLEDLLGARGFPGLVGLEALFAAI